MVFLPSKDIQLGTVELSEEKCYNGIIELINSSVVTEFICFAI